MTDFFTHNNQEFWRNKNYIDFGTPLLVSRITFMDPIKLREILSDYWYDYKVFDSSILVIGDCRKVLGEEICRAAYIDNINPSILAESSDYKIDGHLVSFNFERDSIDRTYLQMSKDGGFSVITAVVNGTFMTFITPRGYCCEF